MKIENVAFPYPVLGIGNNITSKSAWHYKVDQNNYEYLITIDIQLNNKSIEDYIKYENEEKIKEAGKLRTEGKDYVVKDGDIFNFKFIICLS